MPSESSELLAATAAGGPVGPLGRFQHVKDERLLRLIRHWLELRGTRAMPARHDIDPVRIFFALPYLWIYDFLPPEDFRCRLLGEEIIDLWGKNPKGRHLRDIFPGAHAQAVTEHLLITVRTGKIMHSTADVLTTDRVSVRGERIALPLAADGATVDTILGATIYDWGRKNTRGSLFASEAMRISYTAAD